MTELRCFFNPFQGHRHIECMAANNPLESIHHICTLLSVNPAMTSAKINFLEQS